MIHSTFVDTVVTIPHFTHLLITLFYLFHRFISRWIKINQWIFSENCGSLKFLFKNIGILKMVGLNLSDSFASSSTSSLGCGRVRGRRSTSIDYDGSINTTSSAVAQRRRRHPAEVSTNSSSTSSSSKNSSRFLPMKGPGYLALVVVVVIITLQFTTSPVLSASLNKVCT